MRTLIKILSLFVFLSTQAFAQHITSGWEYLEHPELTYEVEHLELNLKINPSQRLIEGRAGYTILSRRPELHTVVMHTSDISIAGINFGDQPVEYRVSGDSLIITLNDTLGLAENTELEITWESSSYYGMQRGVTGSLWSSLNRNALHHWMPVFDHPRIVASTDAYITAPVSMEVSFNGERISDEVASTDQKRVHFRSETPLPVTGLSFAVGPFAKEEAISGIKKVSLYTPQNILMDEVRAGLLRMAVNELKNIENRLSFEYPYDALNIVILPDHYWQEKQAGAGVIYLYQSLGSLSVQLKRALAAQWFGNYHRYVDIEDDLMKSEFLKTALLNNNTGRLLNPDSLHSVEAWNRWQYGYMELENEFMKETMENSFKNLIRTMQGSVYWREYAAYWYDQSGAWWDELPEVSGEMAEIEAKDSRVTYQLNADYDDINGNLNLVFESLNGSADSLLGINMNIHTIGETSTEKISFTGTLDTVSISLPNTVEYITFSSAETNIKRIEIRKIPIMFLLSQLRSDDPEVRAQAASLLSYHSDNPDIQLALRDIMRDEQSPEVLAAIYKTLAKITDGATGTEQTFLDALRSDSEEIRLAAIKSLSNFRGNESVKSTIRSVILRAEKDTVFNTALRTYKEIAEGGDLISLADRLQQTDSTGIRSLYVLGDIMTDDSTGLGLEIADRFTRDRYPFKIRKKAFNLLYTHDDEPAYWQAKLPLLLEDADPRMRYLVLKATGKLSEQEANELLSSRVDEEFDPRVKHRINELLSR